MTGNWNTCAMLRSLALSPGDVASVETQAVAARRAHDQPEMMFSSVVLAGSPRAQQRVGAAVPNVISRRLERVVPSLRVRRAGVGQAAQF